MKTKNEKEPDNTGDGLIYLLLTCLLFLGAMVSVVFYELTGWVLFAFLSGVLMNAFLIFLLGWQP